MKSSSMKEVTEDFKNKNLAKINAEFEKMKAEGQDNTSIGFNIGLKFQDIANKTMESYLKAKDLNINADTKYDIVADLMYEAIPKAVNAYVEGQRFIDYVKENNLSKEDAAVEFKNRNLKETSGTERFDRLYGMAKGEVKQATITSYILGNLTNQLIGVFKMPKYEGIFKNVSFDAQKVDKLQAEGELDIPVSEQGFVDTSSPVQKVQRTRKSAESMLGLSEKTKAKVNDVVSKMLKEPIKDLDARFIGNIDAGPAGTFNIVMLEGNKARVTYPDGKQEIMLGARSAKPIVLKIIKKLKSDAFQRLRAPKATDAEKAKAQEDQQKLQVEMSENEKDRQNDITLAEIRSAGYGSMVDINQNQQSDFQDAMKDIRETTQYREQMNLKREENASKSSMENSRLSVEREKIAADKQIANTKLQIARENKNKYDSPKKKDKK